METKLIKINPDKLTKESFKEAADIIRSGGLVAFPTETVYGLGANALDDTAAVKIYKAKGRPSDNPLIVHISNVKDMEELALDIPDIAYRLAEVFWPGPLTMILKKKACVPYATTGGLDTVGIRLPANRIARFLISEAQTFIAAPSANLSGKPSPTMAEHVYKDLNGRIDMIIDGGKAVYGLESTIVDLTGELPVILRPGCITDRMLESVAGRVELDPAILQKTPMEGLRPKAPGMKYRHYAPEGKLIIYEGNIDRVIAVINLEVEKKLEEGHRAGVIATDESLRLYSCGIVKSVGSRRDETSIAAGLYKVLREFDEAHVDYIYSESFADNSLGQAIMNRLLKAAGYSVVKI
ncbi:MAG: threonylcarbamoyl-AMP synthase [Clostridiales bacterium]|nr:threonylcarbamoyl-AMP synthase [Clostridiales bacterium]